MASKECSESSTDRICFRCAEMNPVFYLTEMRIFLLQGHATSIEYPKSIRPLESMLVRKQCPLCRLICRAIAAKLGKASEYLEAMDRRTQVSLRYVRPDSLRQAHHASEGLKTKDFMQAGRLFLETSIESLNLQVWIHALVLEPPAISQVPLVLHSEIDDDKGFTLDMRVFDRAFRQHRDELEDLLKHPELSNLMVGREISEMVDVSLVLEWLRLCDEHGERCRPEPLIRSKNAIWLIDVKERRLVSAFDEIDGHHPKFAALSYVWGGDENPQLKYSSVNGIEARLKSPGGLSDHHTDIPHTVSDSMLLCERLSIPYLWVDALCLDQDFNHPQSNPDMSSLLKSMGDIYQSAYLTIVCAAGGSSWAGLPGIRPERGRSRPTLMEHVQQQWLGVYSGSTYEHLSSKKWNTRSWTFQEQLLSRRLLIFTDEEVLFECDSGRAWREGIFSEHPGIPPEDFEFPLAKSTFKVCLDAILDDSGRRPDASSVSSDETPSLDDDVPRGDDDSLDEASSRGSTPQIDDIEDHIENPAESDTSPKHDRGDRDQSIDLDSIFSRENHPSWGTESAKPTSSGNSESPRVTIRVCGKHRMHFFFTKLIHEYLGRQMAKASDALRAFEGVLTRIQRKTLYEFSDGIPVDLFHDCLFFDVPNFKPELRRDGFPSWNWTGWNTYQDNADRGPPVRFWDNDTLQWLTLGVPVFRTVGFQISETSGRESQSNSDEDSLVIMEFDEIIHPGVGSPQLGRGRLPVAASWIPEMNHLIFLLTDVLKVRVSEKGDSVDGRPNERRYHIISPDLGFSTINLDMRWREQQGENIRLVMLGATEAFDPNKKSRGFINIPVEPGEKERQRGWEGHLVARVIVLLCERDERGIYRRAGMFKIETTYWDAAPTRRRLLPLR